MAAAILLTSKGTIAEAILMEDGKIKAVGTNDEIMKMAGDDADVIDAREKQFCLEYDSHCICSATVIA